MEVGSEVLEKEIDTTKEDKMLDIRLALIQQSCNLSTEETASVREWWRFSYLFDIGKHLFHINFSLNSSFS